MFRGRNFFIKRDDLIDPLLSGNKYRKLYSLIQAPAVRYKTIISYGGTQSNAMLSMAALCQQKGWGFHYTSKPVPGQLKNNILKSNTSGNLGMALKLGMILHEVPHDQYDDAIAALPALADDTTLYLPQGGADPIARHGIQQLACEIQHWQQACSIEHQYGIKKHPGIKKLHVISPSGTGTTAFYLAHALRQFNINVLTTASVGGSAYLRRQMHCLGEMPDNLRILDNSKTYHFAKPYPEFLAIYQELKTAGIEFDLIYASKMWLTLLQHIDNIEGSILYVHSGGLSGNASMLARYRYSENNVLTR